MMKVLGDTAALNTTPNDWLLPQLSGATIELPVPGPKWLGTGEDVTAYRSEEFPKEHQGRLARIPRVPGPEPQRVRPVKLIEPEAEKTTFAPDSETWQTMDPSAVELPINRKVITAISASFFIGVTPVSPISIYESKVNLRCDS